MSTSDTELEYLSPTFDPSSLTVPRLRSILVSHNISYPSSAKKPQLIEIFNENVLPQSRRILSARSRTKRTSRGITDIPSSQEGTINGDEEDDEDTGLMPPPPIPKTRKRASRKSRSSEAEESTDDMPGSHSKSTVQETSPRRASSKHGRASDTDTAAETAPKRSAVRKTRRSEVTPTVKIEEPEPHAERPVLDRSAFSHENPFQSGSSPASGDLATPAGERRRKSLGTSTSKSGDKRKTSATRPKTEKVVNSNNPPQEDGIKVPSSKSFDMRVARQPKVKTEDDENEPEIGEEFTPEEQLELARERAMNGQSAILPPRRKNQPQQAGRISKSAPWVVVLTLLSGYATWWRREKLDIGYCGVGRPSSALTNVQVPDWAKLLQPECEPCPQHAYCYPQLETRCEPDFVHKPHPLSLGGLVPLPPTCEPDGEKVRRVKAVADRAVEELRERRAKWECGELKDVKGKPAPVEVGMDCLKKDVGKKRRRGMGDAEFEDLWVGAIGEILGREEISSDVDGKSGHRRLASNSLARLPLSCAVKRSARLALARHRVELAGLISILLLIAAARYQFTSLRDANARVPQLVAVTLNRLATQAALSVQDPRAVPEAWISVGQLRDDVLRDEFSAKRRESLWRKVKAVVEMNANVRASVREGRGGEVSRVWEWIGSVGALEDGWASGKRESGRYSLGPAGGSSPVDTTEGRHEMIQRGTWDEGRPIY
ncbi:MAG: inner nuclear membrane protein enriched at telomere/subtelomere region [Candelina mexicana]|nr:MAG: inner nuclear membrane protein enriched at telomere/subtelomere region [Candelina mexicana]